MKIEEVLNTSGETETGEWQIQGNEIGRTRNRLVLTHYDGGSLVLTPSQAKEALEAGYIRYPEADPTEPSSYENSMEVERDQYETTFILPEIEFSVPTEVLRKFAKMG